MSTCSILYLFQCCETTSRVT